MGTNQQPQSGSRRADWRRWIHGALEPLVYHFAIQDDRPVFVAGQFSWIRQVEASWQRVRRALHGVVKYQEVMPHFQDILREMGSIQKDGNGTTFFLMGVGMDGGENARRCPETMGVRARIPLLHLALMVPEPRDHCRIRIADQIHTWHEGRCLVFDDTYNHQVWNDTDGYRVVLFVDFERPLHWPLRSLNHWLLNLAALAPFLREANARQQAAERSFWRRMATAGEP